jgi:hypothetical protein
MMIFGRCGRMKPDDVPTAVVVVLMKTDHGRKRPEA